MALSNIPNEMTFKSNFRDSLGFYFKNLKIETLSPCRLNHWENKIRYSVLDKLPLLMLFLWSDQDT